MRRQHSAQIALKSEKVFFFILTRKKLGPLSGFRQNNSNAQFPSVLNHYKIFSNSIRPYSRKFLMVWVWFFFSFRVVIIYNQRYNINIIFAFCSIFFTVFPVHVLLWTPTEEGKSFIASYPTHKYIVLFLHFYTLCAGNVFDEL